MKNSKNKGVRRSTKKNKHTVGNKRILSVSNRKTGTKGKGKGKVNKLGIELAPVAQATKGEYSVKLSPTAQANLDVVQEHMAKQGKYIKAVEFEGNGKVLEIIKAEADLKGKFGEAIQFLVREPETNKERLWTTSSSRAIAAVFALMKKGQNLMRIWSTGTGTDKQYYAEAVQMKKKKKKVKSET